MMVKKRDFWMPFAPVVRMEKQAEYINNPKGTKYELILSVPIICDFDNLNYRKLKTKTK